MLNALVVIAIIVVAIIIVLPIAAALIFTSDQTTESSDELATRYRSRHDPRRVSMYPPLTCEKCGAPAYGYWDSGHSNLLLCWNHWYNAVKY